MENSIKDISTKYLNNNINLPDKERKLIDSIGKELEEQEKVRLNNNNNQGDSKYREFMKEELGISPSHDID